MKDIRKGTIIWLRVMVMKLILGDTETLVGERE